MKEREKFEKWLHEYYYSNGFNVDPWEAWQAALSTRKPYGYGIVDKNGEGIEGIATTEKRCAEIEAQSGNDNKYSSLRPFRVVELFYEEQS